MPNKWDQYAEPESSSKWDKYAEVAPTAQNKPPTPKLPSWADRAGLENPIARGVSDLAEGAVSGAASTIGHVLESAKGAPFLGIGLPALPKPKPGVDIHQRATEAFPTPDSTPGKVGRIAEQTAEFVLPSNAAAAATKGAGLAARALGQGLASGLVTSAQTGGDLPATATSAAMGAAGPVVGDAARWAANSVAEGALGLRGVDRAFHKTPGKAILEETSGLRPKTIAASAQARAKDLTSQMEAIVDAATVKGDLGPARQVVEAELQKAMTEGSEPTVQALMPIRERLAKLTSWPNGVDAATVKTPLAQSQPMRRVLNIKRGLSKDFVKNWNPNLTPEIVRSTGRQAYGALDNVLDQAGPEVASLNQRVSSLIPVANRAEAVGLNAEMPQRVLGRLGAYTGALAGAGTGAGIGYANDGWAGAGVGALSGLALQEAANSPVTKMALARGLYGAANRLPSWMLPAASTEAMRPPTPKLPPRR